MKATYNWIKEYVPTFTGDVQEMSDLFTMSGTEVEFWEPAGDDWVIEFAVTSNRVDCLGIVGLARELAAASGEAFVHPDCEVDESAESVDDRCTVELVDREGCPRYTAMVIEGVEVRPSPDWMRERLEAIGLRSVNNIVDATNYVLFEMNQPFHAFDHDKLSEGRIVVRRAAAGEKIVAINDKEYELQSDMTMICDAEGPMAIGGVMGGARSEVSDATTNLLLETAAFEMLGIRRTSKRLGLSSDSSFRFERGIDHSNVIRAARRCARLILEVAGGSLRRGIVDADATSAEPAEIPFDHARVRRVTGIEIPWTRCREIFESLEFEIEGDPDRGIRVKVPAYRRDLVREIDLVEEVIRIHGLEAIPVETSMSVMTVKDTKKSSVRRVVKDALVGCGFSETLTTSFLEASAASGCFFGQGDPVTIRNAMRRDENALRQSLLPSMLQVRKTNQDFDNHDVRIFECTVVYLSQEGGGIPVHLPIVGGLLDGNFREIRGVVHRVVTALGIEEIEFTTLDEDGQRLLDSDGGATVKLADGKVLGHVGRPRAEVVQAHDLREPPYYVELRLDELTERAQLTPRFTPLSRFPAVKRDLAIVVDEDRPWGEVESLMRDLHLADLESLEFFDEYRGKQVGRGKKSLAFSMTFRSHERTLTGEEVDATRERAMRSLEETLGAKIRE